MIRVVENGRLVYYRRKADAAFWENHWREHVRPEHYTAAEKGHLDLFEDVFTRYLPRRGRILEAGCGTGRYVMALRARGYNAEGIDWAAETIQAVRTLHPDLPVRAGDLSCLDVPDGSYHGYISLGVVEHVRSGPEPLLREAFRVLAAGGTALISVPFFHPLRHLKTRLGLYGGRSDGLEFYQYAFMESDFTSQCRSAGFQLVERRTYDGLKGLSDEVPFVRTILRLKGIGPYVRKAIAGWSWLERRIGHMILLVVRKPL